MDRPTVEVREETRTPSEWLAAADELSQRVVHLNARAAYERVRQGDYEGTPFASKLSQLMFLAGYDQTFRRGKLCLRETSVGKYDESKVISVAEHFTQFPAGRTRGDGPWSGEAFRQDVLAPELRRHGSVRVRLDGTMGYGSSFLREAFGGLVGEFTPGDLKRRLTVEATDGSLIKEVWTYILEGGGGQQPPTP